MSAEEILTVEEGHRVILTGLRERPLSEPEMATLLAAARENKLRGQLHELVQKGELEMWLAEDGEVMYGPPKEQR